MDWEQAVSRILQAIGSKEDILVYGDYDETV
jgi:single-stranded DNA-specific DHH superfamily exonuclease